MTLARADSPSLCAESEMSTFSPATLESGPESILKYVWVLNGGKLCKKKTLAEPVD